MTSKRYDIIPIAIDHPLLEQLDNCRKQAAQQLCRPRLSRSELARHALRFFLQQDMSKIVENIRNTYNPNPSPPERVG